MRIAIARIKEWAAKRPAGYERAVLGAGTVDGEWLVLTQEAYAGLKTKYAPGEPLPTKLQMVRSVAGAVFRTVAAATSRQGVFAEQETRQRRAEICGQCEWHLQHEDQCGKCGCFLSVKRALLQEYCPIGKW